MDPKMDSGSERSGYNSIEEAIEDGVAPIPLSLDRTLDVQRSIDVMDHLFSCEVLKSSGFKCTSFVTFHAWLNKYIGILYFSGHMAQGSHSCSDRLYMYLPYENGENFIACCIK
jgi:hypothetical protein